MLVLLSPAKTLDYHQQAPFKDHTLPDFLKETSSLASELKRKKVKDLQELMGVSEKIATVNVERFKAFNVPFPETEAKQAIYAFNGDVYAGLKASEWSYEQLLFAQAHLRILSGFYGLLRPLDLMMPYRLEMGTKLKTKRGKDLYQFWGDGVTLAINGDLEKQQKEDKVIINLASLEYAKVVSPKALIAAKIDIEFRNKVKGVYQVVGLHAKYARGLMASYICRHQLTHQEALKDFAEEGYRYDAVQSTDTKWIFLGQ
ncbi:MAG: peroxide stress protein YaaA [Alphaproteobacteria bacterium]|nr:peroxide stress protein YaaA [Alphaproteobacteria bacterium]